MSKISQFSLVNFALDLSAAVSMNCFYESLISAVCATIKADAVALLIFRHETLVPVAQRGLSDDVMGRRFIPEQHPRLKAICSTRAVTRFSADSPLPDPYDGMIASHNHNMNVHSCMGIPLYKDETLLGVLTLDSLEPNEYDALDAASVDTLSRLAARLLYAALYIRELNKQKTHTQHVLRTMNENNSEHHQGEEMIGNSVTTKKLKQTIRLAASSDLTILVHGETGVGKELVVRELHYQSNRRNKPLVYVNCAAIPVHLIESELFGHVKGAFTSAANDRDGKFLLADGGTLFLDEIGELPLEIQGTLLRVIQNQEIQVVGQDKSRKVDVRIIAATNRELGHEVKNKRFRADLYHRLIVFPIYVPPLRDRQCDVPLLAGYFAEKMRRSLGLQKLILAKEAIYKLTVYHWPGNVRELEHVISRAALYAREKNPTGNTIIEPSDITGLTVSSDSLTSKDTDSSTVYFETDSHTDLREATDKFQRQLIIKALHHAENNWSKAARSLSMDRANLVRLAKRLNITLVKKIRT